MSSFKRPISSVTFIPRERENVCDIVGSVGEQVQTTQTVLKMHIENPDALRNWLTPVLEPLCDADPTALAKYVLALLKKDKPQAELEGCMAEQLDVFLGKETKPFLEKLFVAMKTHEYLQPEKSAETSSAPRDSTPPLSQTSTTSLSSSGRKTKEEGEKPASFNKLTVAPQSKSKSQEPLSKNLPEAREVRRRRISNRSKSRSKTRSRSKSLERIEKIRRSRSRDRRLADHKNSRSYRNSSPPSRRYDRKNDRNTSPKPHRGPSNRSARSRSSSPRTAYKKSPNRSQLEDEKPTNKRCRDFEEKGYCMRGETCPWDHGVDPVVLEDLSNPSLAMNQPAMSLRNPPLHSEYNPDAPDLWNRGPPGGFGPGSRPMHLPVPGPRQQFFGFRAGPPGFQLGVPPLPRELIPVPVMDPNHPGDILGPHMKRRFETDDAASMPENVKRKVPINSRLGPRVNPSGVSGNSSQNCSLELRKIPRGLNAISHLNDHFSKFGKITNIQIAYEGDPEAAIVSFTSHAEANVAYRSTEAVLNNRFIKVFWHSGNGSGTGENQSMNGPTGSLPKVSELSVRRFPSTSQAVTVPITAAPADSTNAIAPTSNPETPTTSAATTNASKGSTTYINSASPAAQQAQQRLKNAKMSRATNDMIQKKQKEQQKVAAELTQGLHQKKQELLGKNIVQMKQLIEKLERTDQLDPARQQLVSTVKALQVNIDNLKQDLKDSVQIVAKTQLGGPQRRTKEQTQKELLDVELELISREQQGDDDTFAIKKRYLELQKSLNRPHYLNSGGIRPAITRPPVVRYGSTSVDRRPTAIKITGFAIEESDNVLGHFKHFGEITKNVLDEALPCFVLSYATRINAEQAFARGRQFKDKQLNIVWYNPTDSKVGDVASCDEKDLNLKDVAKDLKADEEKKEGSDDDDMEEERSWRRGYDAE